MKYSLPISILMLTFFLSIESFAQWESLDPNIIPQNHRVWSIKVAPDASVWAIATFDNFPPTNQVPKTYRSTDEGQSWVTAQIPAAISSFGWDISPIDSNHAFIALDTAGLYQTSDGGQNWVKNDSFIYNPVYVHFFNAEEGWSLAYGDNEGVVMSITEDGGDSWLFITYGNTPLGTSLPFLDTDEGILPFSFSVNSAYDYTSESILLGTTKGRYIISNDKGKNWQRRGSPLEDLELNTSVVAMKDENTYMVAGDTEQVSFDGTPAKNFATTDNGTTWIEGSSGMIASAIHYIPNSDSVFIMVGHNNFGWGSEGTAISYDYGANWERIDNTSLIAIDFIDENTGYGACCNNGWFTANGQFSKWNFSLPTSTVELAKIDVIKIMPNPVSHNLTVILNNQFQSENLIIEINAANGQTISNFQMANREQVNIPVHDLPKGFYTLRITGNQESVIKKFIKE